MANGINILEMIDTLREEGREMPYIRLLALHVGALDRQGKKPTPGRKSFSEGYFAAIVDLLAAHHDLTQGHASALVHADMVRMRKALAADRKLEEETKARSV